MSFRTLAAAGVLFASTALAKTDLQGCTYIDGVYSPPHGPAWATRTWYVPDTGEICEFLDCGGGRAPPKTDVPGCGNYRGTETYSPIFLDLASITGDGEVVQTSTNEVEETAAPTTTSVPEDDDEETKDHESHQMTTTMPSLSHTTTTSVVEETSSEETPSLTASPPSPTSPPPSETTSTSDGDDDEFDPPSYTTYIPERDPPGAANAPVAALFGSSLAAGLAILYTML